MPCCYRNDRSQQYTMQLQSCNLLLCKTCRSCLDYRWLKHRQHLLWLSTNGWSDWVGLSGWLDKIRKWYIYHKQWGTTGKWQSKKNRWKMMKTGKEALLPLDPWKVFCNTDVVSARQHICYSALYAIARPSVRLSVRLSHGWISQRRLKLGSRNLHHRVAPWL